MAIISRVSRLFRADVHAVLDRIEEPHALLKQSLREMDAVVAERTRQLQQRQAERDRCRERCRQIDQAIAAIAEELDLSFEAGNDELIRRCLRRRLQLQRQQAQLAQRGNELEAEIASASAALAEQGERLAGLRQQAALLELPGDSASDPADPTTVTEADVDLALLRELQLRRTP